MTKSIQAVPQDWFVQIKAFCRIFHAGYIEGEGFVQERAMCLQVQEKWLPV